MDKKLKNKKAQGLDKSLIFLGSLLVLIPILIALSAMTAQGGDFLSIFMSGPVRISPVESGDTATCPAHHIVVGVESSSQDPNRLNALYCGDFRGYESPEITVDPGHNVLYSAPTEKGSSDNTMTDDTSPSEDHGDVFCAFDYSICGAQNSASGHSLDRQTLAKIGCCPSAGILVKRDKTNAKFIETHDSTSSKFMCPSGKVVCSMKNYIDSTEFLSGIWCCDYENHKSIGTVHLSKGDTYSFKKESTCKARIKCAGEGDIHIPFGGGTDLMFVKQDTNELLYCYADDDTWACTSDSCKFVLDDHYHNKPIEIKKGSIFCIKTSEGLYIEAEASVDNPHILYWHLIGYTDEEGNRVAI